LPMQCRQRARRGKQPLTGRGDGKQTAQQDGHGGVCVAQALAETVGFLGTGPAARRSNGRANGPAKTPAVSSFNARLEARIMAPDQSTRQCSTDLLFIETNERLRAPGTSKR
jgi:hypothetical protein